MSFNLRHTSYKRWLILAAAVLCLACLALIWFEPEVLARVGGGQSHSGGGRSSGGGSRSSSGGGSRSSGGSGGGNGGGAVIGIFRMLYILTVQYPAIGIPLDLLIIGYVVYRLRRRGTTPPSFVSNTSGYQARETDGGAASGARTGFAQEFNLLRRFDPNFSEIIFTDFCYALYARAQESRGRGAEALGQLSPYLSQEARASLLQRNPPNLLGMTGIIVGAMTVADVRGLDSPLVRISLDFETNYTEVTGAENGAGSSEMSYYARERWELERKRDVLSPTPVQAVALHCPRCGAPLEAMTNGVCGYCGTRVESGEFQWFVRGVRLEEVEARGPLLTSDVPEVGTDYQTVMQQGFDAVSASFQAANPSFSWTEFEARARLIFNELQAAWSSLQWERARPHETDNIFQMHRYWIEAYRRQGLRNILDQCKINAIQPVKIKEDTFYYAITLRIWAEGYDYTVDERGRVVAGSKERLRRWSEYWTFIRHRDAQPTHARADLNCPNCGAPLKVNATGICEFCGGKMTSGEFDWVLSKIEQDESYAG